MIAFSSRIALVSLLTLSALTQAAMPLHPDRLTVEHLAAPVGIDKPQPRFSWILSAPEDRKNIHQTAYQLRVIQDGKPLWDTGKVTSASTLDIPYAGPALPPQTPFTWSVKVWDEAGNPTEETSSTFSTGYLPAAPWSPAWIGFDAPNAAVRSHLFGLDGAKWIRHPDDADEAPVGTRSYTARFSLPDGATSARILLSADDEFVLYLNGQLIGQSMGRDSWKKAEEYNILSRLRPGSNDIRVDVKNTTVGPTALIAKLEAVSPTGTTLFTTDESWQATDLGATVRAPANTPPEPPTTQASPKPAKVLGAYGISPWENVRSAPVLPPPVLLRREFTPAKTVKRAVLYATALGNVDMYLNGARVSDDLFTPGWTDYRKRVYYRAYDVTSRITPGANAVGAILADGWFAGHVAWGQQRDHYGTHTRLAASLHLDYTDGSSETIDTGSNWTAATGPYLFSDFLKGESYDARNEINGSLAGFSLPGAPAPEISPRPEAKRSPAAWSPVDTGSPDVTPAAIEWHPAPPVDAFEEFSPVSIKEISKGTYILNLGQNFAGFARLKLKNVPAGTEVTLRFAERLSPDGSLYTTNLRTATSTDTYTAKGLPEETWSPRFTFHGFQYVEITGLPYAPEKDTVTGVAISSSTPVVGTFDCSDPMLNRLHKNIYYTQRMNFIDIPTDCPQRDERLGWTADAQVYFQAGTLNTDLHAFMDKWLVDLDDAQEPNGNFTKVAPLIAGQNDGGPAWADAGTVVPFEHYDIYGDRRQLERSYPHMVKFVEFTKSRCKPDLSPPDKFHCFGDWLSIKADTPHDVIFSAYFARSTYLTAKAAEALGKTDDAAKYNALFQNIKKAFNRDYLDHNYKIKGHTQCDYVLALAFDLVDGPAKQAAIDYLIKDIESRESHLSTGFVGTKELMPVLSKIGRPDVAFTLLHNKTFPSWGFSIQHGATSIWERWDGWTPEKGFQTPGMNSFAHYSFGAVYRWMAETLGGIQQADDSLAFSHPRLAPTLDPKLTHCTTTYLSPQGQISSAWKRDGDTITWTVTLPPNTTTTLILPTKSPASIQEDGHPLAEKTATLTRGSGTYTYTFTE